MPPLFDEEMEEVVEAWLINMKKVFLDLWIWSQFKTILEIYQFQVGATLWWEEIRIAQGIDE